LIGVVVLCDVPFRFYDSVASVRGAAAKFAHVGQPTPVVNAHARTMSTHDPEVLVVAFLQQTKKSHQRVASIFVVVVV
jgi:hypothetical protein